MADNVLEIEPGGDAVAALASRGNSRQRSAPGTPTASDGGGPVPRTTRTRRPSPNAAKWTDQDLQTLSYLIAALVYGSCVLVVEVEHLPDYVLPDNDESEGIARPLARIISRRIPISASGDFTDGIAVLSAVVAWQIRVYQTRREIHNGGVPRAFTQSTNGHETRPYVPPQATQMEGGSPFVVDRGN